jgi:hypothetical protein
MVMGSAGQRSLKLHSYEEMIVSRMRAYDGAFEHAEAGRCLGVKSGGNRHLDHDVLGGREALERDEQTAGADVHRGSEFKGSAPILIYAVDENGEGQGDTLPASGLVLGLGHV